MKTVLSRALAVGSALVVAACAESASPAQPSSPGQPSGGPLSVSIAPSTLACYPRPQAPCSIYVEAVVTNANGRPVSYAWSGCGSGTAYNTTCWVERPGPLTVTVDVTDIRGQTARATGTPAGTNLPPTATITDSVLWESWNAATGGGSFEVDAFLRDPERSSSSACGSELAARTVVAAGICEKGYLRCTTGALDVGAIKTAPSGMCVLTLTGVDEWGLTGTTTKTFTLPHK